MIEHRQDHSDRPTPVATATINLGTAGIII